MHKSAGRWGYPGRFLTDNGRIFTTPMGSGVGAMETELLGLGIGFRHSRPNHPQTCGKVERFHLTMKRYLARQEPAPTKKALQGQLDRFVEHYNTRRAHRSLDGRTPLEAFCAREKAGPSGTRIEAAGYRVRHDKVETLRVGDAALQGQAPPHRRRLSLCGVAGDPGPRD
jgi:hypothetical protein